MKCTAAMAATAAMAIGVLAATPAGVRAQEATEGKVPLMQIAILLDTSGSMSGLIEQAKTQLWSIVNEFATGGRGDVQAELEVALYEYGKSTVPAADGYVRMILPLTTDLDRVSEELFQLETNGGDEYCGQVIGDAVADLAWSESDTDYRAVFIAGNEPFTQGVVDYRESCKAAVTNGILLNTIHCGDREVGVSGMWADGAALGDGEYLSIDHNRAIPHIEAPQDAEIVRLGQDLNATYIHYGAMGAAGLERQAAQDRNAAGLSVAVAAQRAAAKASVQYRNASWDLVDAAAQAVVNLEDVDPEGLPEEMREMTVEERAGYVARKAEERAAVQARIRELSAERRAYVEAERKRRAESGDDTFDLALVKAARAQAEAREFAFGG